MGHFDTAFDIDMQVRFRYPDRKHKCTACGERIKVQNHTKHVNIKTHRWSAVGTIRLHYDCWLRAARALGMTPSRNDVHVSRRIMVEEFE